MAGTLGRGGTCQSKLPRRVQEARRCESHLVFCCPEVTLFLCGHWLVYSCSPGSGSWTFQGPCRAACVLCSHGRCHMSALLPGELEGGIVPLESKVLLLSANPLVVLPRPVPRHPLLSHQGLRDGGHPCTESLGRALCVYWEVGRTCPSMSQPSSGSKKPKHHRLQWKVSVPPTVSHSTCREQSRVSSSHLKGQVIG